MNFLRRFRRSNSNQESIKAPVAHEEVHASTEGTKNLLPPLPKTIKPVEETVIVPTTPANIPIESTTKSTELPLPQYPRGRRMSEDIGMRMRLTPESTSSNDGVWGETASATQRQSHSRKVSGGLLKKVMSNVENGRNSFIETADELIEKIKRDSYIPEQNFPVFSPGSESDIAQSSAFAAFGVTLPSTIANEIIQQDESDIPRSTIRQSLTSHSLSTHSEVETSIPISNKMTKTRSRRHSLTADGNASVYETLMKQNHSGDSIHDTTFTSSRPASKAGSRRTSILKNAERTSGSAVEISKAVDTNILVDYGGDVIHYTKESEQLMKPSIMAALAGNSIYTGEFLHDSIKDSLQSELPYFEENLQKSMKPSIFLTNEYIIHQHDIGHEMYFLSRGKVEILSSDGKTQCIYILISRWCDLCRVFLWRNGSII